MDYHTQNQEFNDAIQKLFHGKTTMERAAAANHLGYLKDKRATNSLAKIIKRETDPIVLNRIIEAMGEIQDVKATMLIVDVLQKELNLPEDAQDKQRIYLIIESLMKIGDKRALEHLGILLDSCDDEIREITEKSMECIDPNWKENLQKSK
ncbi:MAG: HEAT repeat domain-containing protein [Candidatus Hermodarchaeota archaeon]